MTRHGIYIKEEATALTVPITGYSAVQVVVGTAPVNMLDDPASAVNVPILATRATEAMERLGYCTDFQGYTLCQTMYVTANIYRVVPVVYINVLDPAKHKKALEETETPVDALRAVVEMTGVLKEGLTVRAGETALELSEDYAKTEHDTLRELIEDAGKVPDGVLTSADKGVVDGVASLDHEGKLNSAQIPPDSGAVYIGEKLSFRSFTWKKVDGQTGWVGTYTSMYGTGADDELIRLAGGYWNEMLLILDPDRLYLTWQESDAEHLACAFCSANFKAFFKGVDGERTIRVFSDTDLGSSEISGIAFWPYIIRRDRPSY